MNINQGSTDTYITNIYGNNLGRYVVRFGAAGSGSRNEAGGLVEGIEGENMNDNPVCMTHWGGFYNTFRNVYANPNTQVMRFRSRHLTIDGFTADGVNTTEFNAAQRPAHCVARNGSVINRSSDDNETVIWTEVGGDSLHGNQRADNIRYENIEIEAHPGHGAGEVGSFGSDATVDGFSLRNVTYGGQQLTASHVEQWAGYSAGRISNVIVE